MGLMRAHTTDLDALTALRVEQDMSLVALARAAGVSYSMVKYVHYGQRQFSPRTAAKIARALDCQVGDFYRPAEQPCTDVA